MPNLLAAIGSGVNRNALESKTPQEMGQYAQMQRNRMSNANFGSWADKTRQQIIARRNPTQALGSFKKGGNVKKTGMYKLHKGEHVDTKKEALKAKCK